MDPTMPSSGDVAAANEEAPLPPPSPVSYDASAANSSPSTQPSRQSRSVSVSSFTGSVSSKSRYAEPGTSEVHAERSSFSSSPHSSNPLKGARPNWDSSGRRQSTASEVLIEEPYLGESQQNGDSDTPRMRPNPDAPANHAAPPEASLPSRSSFSDSQSIRSKRLSGTSLYSLASARGVINPPQSNPVSDQNPPPRSVPSLMSSGKGPASAQSETALSGVTVTTSSGNQSGHGSPNNHSLAARETQTPHHDLVRRNQRAETTPMRSSQPDRSRSRAKRRFSGSTAYSSQSPSSERGPHHREKEEGTVHPPYSIVKPYLIPSF
ncbi:hypothetical protein HDV57DRAFT_442941 [Trichoderma longibrachiatum]